MTPDLYAQYVGITVVGIISLIVGLIVILGMLGVFDKDK